jgi:hypothetical protein
MTGLAQRLKRFDEEEDELLAMIRADFPDGRVVQWRHGEHWRTARVIGWSGMQLHTASFKVRSWRTDREYWVSALWVLRDMGYRE